MNNTLRNLSTVAVIALLVMLGASCDLMGSSSKSGASVRSANDALRAIPLATEVVGLNNSSGALEASSISALGNGDDNDHGINDTDHPGAGQIFDSWLGDFPSGDVLIAILKALADEVDLVMGTENRLGMNSTGFLREICEADPENDVEAGECDYAPAIDLGVVVVTEPVANRVNIQWVFDSAGLATDDDEAEVTGSSSEQEILLIDVTLGGWPNSITTADFWLIINSGEHVNWEYQSMNLTTNTVNKYIDQLDEFGDEDEHYNKHERMIFRGDGQGGMDAFVSIEAFDLASDNPMEGGNPGQYVMSFRTRSDHTALAVTTIRAGEADSREYVELFPRTNWGKHDEQVLPTADDANKLAEDNPDGSEWTIHDKWFVKDAVWTGLAVNPKAQLENFLTMSENLYPVWDSFEMPAKPTLATDFPQL